ncbi:MAG: hypothetical protein R3B95_04740 [Nitrospirales bacterium]|nr:carboxypeptidase-like regulatory domain-containing protein [Nitrospirales bacterium]
MDGYGVRRQERNYTALSLVMVGLMLWVLLSGRTVGAYQEEVVVREGSISGVVRFSGMVPAPKTHKVTMGSNPEFCQTIADKNGVIGISEVQVFSKQQLADVVVFLQEVERGKSVPKKGPVVTVDRCQFVPRVIGVMEEQTLKIAMRDPIVHQIRGWEMLDRGRLPMFHFPDMEEGGEATVPLKTRRSSIIKLECDQHRFMQGWLLLTANPYVTVSDHDGFFRLTNVPEGTHTVGAWHPVLGYQEAKLTLISGQEKTLELTFMSVSKP